MGVTPVTSVPALCCEAVLPCYGDPENYRVRDGLHEPSSRLGGLLFSFTKPRPYRSASSSGADAGVGSAAGNGCAGGDQVSLENVVSTGGEDPDPWQFVVLAFSALASEPRLRLLQALGGGPVGASELARLLRLSPSSLNRHATILLRAGVIRTERSATRRTYSIDLSPGTRALLQLAAQVRENQPPESRVFGQDTDRVTPVDELAAGLIEPG